MDEREVRIRNIESTIERLVAEIQELRLGKVELCYYKYNHCSCIAFIKEEVMRISAIMPRLPTTLTLITLSMLLMCLLAQ